jgi:aerobic-type carbon monoxide dehydrogenase small subunit (CoxS/CutS family)
MAEITLRVNGNTRKVDVVPETPLLWVLRDDEEEDSGSADPEFVT